MTEDTELQTIGELARASLKLLHGQKLPKTLSDALNNIFTQGAGQNIEFRKKVVASYDVRDSRYSKHRIVRGKNAVVYNALCLFHLYGVALTKQIFNQKIVTHQPINEIFHSQQLEKNCFRYACMGGGKKHFDDIKQCLSDDSFDLMAQRLPSPFNDKSDGLSPMIHYYQYSIPWQQYLSKFQLAQQYWQAQELYQAKTTLEQLLTEAIIVLPVAQNLLDLITEQENQAQEAYDYIQNMLN